MPFTAVYDACVLHPAGLRDLLVRLAVAGLLRARCSEDILTEMVESVLRRRPDLMHADLERTRELMCEAVPDCMVTGYHDLIAGLSLPDPDDRHVLAAAIYCGAQVIVTENISDFPVWALDAYHVEAQTPDVFLLRLIDSSPDTVVRVIRQQAAALTRPPLSVTQVLDSLARSGLHESAAELRHLQ